MFLSKNEIIRRVNDCDGLCDIEENEEFVYAYDEENDMDIYFHYLENLNLKDLFNFGTLKVDTDKFFKILKECLDPILFLIPVKVYFISSEEELNALLDTEEYGCQGLNISNTIGINWTLDSTIVINIELIKKLAKEEEENFDANYNTSLNTIIWTTLIHELRHMICDICLIVYENEILISDGAEDAVEDYCNNIFDNIIAYEDFIVFND